MDDNIPSLFKNSSSSSPAIRFLGILKQPDSDQSTFEFDESDILWSMPSSPIDLSDAATGLASPVPSNSSNSSSSSRLSFRLEKIGLSAALADNLSPVVQRKPAMDPSLSAATAAATIPRIGDEFYISGMSGKFLHSAPLNVPVWPKGGSRKESSKLEFFEEIEDEDEEEEMLPPHEIVARSHKSSFSVFEGVGRTLKGRDLRRVRNAVWRKTESNSDGSGTIPAAPANDLEKGKAEVDEAFTIWELDEALLDSKIKKFTWLLKESAGGGGASCSIFRIPQSLAKVRPMDYQPHIASFGPYHRGQDGLQMFDQHKWRFLNDLIGRSKKKNGMGLADYLHAMVRLEADARERYSETISLDSKTFVEMMLLDSCFIVELFCKFDREIYVAEGDPIFSTPSLLPYLMRDLLRLENQIPFFVIQKVFDLSDNKKGSSLVALALKMFSVAIYRSDKVISWCEKLPEPKHLLDLFRSSFIPLDLEVPGEGNKSVQRIHCVSKLLRAGIEFKAIEIESFLMINFKKGTLEISKVTIDDFFSSFLQNCVAYEQSHQHSCMYITTFATFLNFLIDTKKDVELLCDEKIINNYFGSDKKVAMFINQLGRNVIFDIKTCHLAKQFEKVNEYYYGSRWNVKYAKFKSTYFSFIASTAALILLILAGAKTFFTIFTYYHPRGK